MRTDPWHRMSLAAIVSTIVLVASASSVGATPPGQNGRIAFMRFDNGHWQIWVSNPDLTAAAQITHEDPDSAIPVWSPNGHRLAFDSSRSDDPNDAIYVNDVFLMDADGANVLKLTDSAGFSGEPAWSPDGSLVAFSVIAGSTLRARPST